MKDNTKKRESKGRGRFIRRMLLAVTLIILAFMLFAAVKVFNMDAWHEFDATKILGASQTLIVYDKDGNEASLLHSQEDRIWIPLRDIPLYVQKAFISAEDNRFYEHEGVDIIRIFGAAWADLKAGGYVQGASTISQQLIKLSHLDARKTMGRKLEEAVLAYQMERAFTKDEVLEMYLNYVYFGGGYYGVEAAARGYFGVHASELTLAQGAMLAGILKSPSAYAPHLDLEASCGRRDVVLKLMLDYGHITQAEYASSVKEPAVLNKGGSLERRGYYIDTALTQACKTLNIDMKTLLTGGYRIYTAMDAELQTHLETLYQNGDLFPSEDVQSATIIVDAQAGTVAAMVGGRGEQVALGWNRAIEMKRQPGSVIKPIIAYAPALEMFGYTTTTMILDEPSSFGEYTPSNFGNKYYGWVTLRTAVQKSLNVPAVKVFSSIGVSTGKAFAQRLGIEFDNRDDSLALVLGGFTYGVSPYQIAAAYASFADGGEYVAPALIQKITDRSGKVLYENQNKKHRVMSQASAYILTSMLKSAIEEGTGKRLGEINIPLAGKTGTVDGSTGNRDAWMVAYNPQYAAVVWMGYDSAATGLELPASATGGTYPAMILSDLFQHLYSEKKAPDFVMPKGVREFRLDKYTLDEEHTAVLASALTPADSVVSEVYVEGTEPSAISSYWAVPRPPTDLQVKIDENNIPVVKFSVPDTFAVYRLYREDDVQGAVKLGEWSGNLNTIEYHDTAAEFGKTYEYYVIPVHPRLQIDGRQVTGASSMHIRVVMPKLLF